MNTWEIAVLSKEMQVDGFQAWYRNPSHSSQDSLGIAYYEHNQIRILKPDFLFFSKLTDGSIAVDIVDPHGIHLSDALPKLKGLANYAENHLDIYRRIEAVAMVGNKLRVLDLINSAVRKAIAESIDAYSLYESDFAKDY